MSDIFIVLYGGNPSHYYLGIGIWHTKKDADKGKLELETRLNKASENEQIVQRLKNKMMDLEDIERVDLRAMNKIESNLFIELQTILEQKTVEADSQ